MSPNDQAHPNPQLVSCPFCGWHRYANTTKGGEPWDARNAMAELVSHLIMTHRHAWAALISVAGLDGQ